MSLQQSISWQIQLLKLCSDKKVEENGGSREVKIGSLRIVTDTDANKVYAHIVFDGDDEVFDGQPIAGGGAWSNVNCKFSTTLEYNGIGDNASLENML